MVADATFEHGRTTVADNHDLPEATVMHQRILQAIARRAPEAARRAMTDHLRAAEQAELARLDGAGSR
jgi:DNA-binding FadR family transcriptional regulator